MNGFAWAPFLWNLPLTAAAVVAVLAVTFVVGVRQDRHSVIDTAWGPAFAAVAVTTFVASAGEGEPARRMLVAALTVVWGVRLGLHIGLRSRGKGEDPRYVELLSRSPGNRHRYALRAVYLVQGVVLWLVSLPVQVAMYEPGPLGVMALLGAVLWAVGLFFEGVGDFQLARFTADPANRGKVMDRGLWRYTRHPNYFGDACVWWGLFLVACDHWIGLLTMPSALLMSYFLVMKTGKPLLEQRLARTREGYAEYVARTSGFVPFPPRRSAISGRRPTG